MPLARIITEVADDCLELTMQLRARGFQVETVAPGEIPSTPADLEVRLEECAPEDVVSHMAQTTAGGDDLWVFVAPGALDSNTLPIRSGPIPIESAIPRMILRKADAGVREMPNVTERIATVSPLAMSAQELKPSVLGKAEPPAVLGSLAIDAAEEDLILAELREFPVPSGATQSVVSASAASLADASVPVEIQPIEILPIEKAGVLTRLADRIAEAKVAEASIPDKSKQGEEKRASETVDAKKAVAPESVKENVVTPKWLQAPEKVATPPHLSIPIAPEPVRATIVLPVARAAQKVKAPRVWNLQKLKVACSVAALAISAWFLIGTSRLGDSGKTAVRPKPTQQESQPSTANAPAQQAQPHVKSPPDARVAAGVPKPSPIPKQTVSSSVPSTAVAASADAASKARPHHSSDEGIIAQDTVVFYDRKQPSSRSNVTQPKPDVKRYSDRE